MAKKRKEPLRRCVVSHEQLPKKEMFRIVRTPEGEVIIDLKGKVNGRGAYLKKSKEIILQAEKRKKLNKHLEVEVPKSIYEELLALLENKDE